MRALGEAGERDAACRLTAEGWWLVREPAPRAARRLNATLHYLTVYHSANNDQEETMSTNTERVLDVRSEPPARRHELILDTYHTLGPGEDFVLVNDHDPKPLWYQFGAEYAGTFSWAYLDEGPEVWRVRIGRSEVRAA